MRVALGLGSNLGDRRAHLEAALRGLDAHADVNVAKVSRFLETEPVGGPPQGPYLNAAVVVETGLEPHGLLEVTRALEHAAGRTREVRHGPRTLDIDILLCDQRSLQTDDLKVPHPHLATRRFVLEPLAEIAPEWIVPDRGRSVEELLADLQDDSRA